MVRFRCLIGSDFVFVFSVEKEKDDCRKKNERIGWSGKKTVHVIIIILSSNQNHEFPNQNQKQKKIKNKKKFTKTASQPASNRSNHHTAEQTRNPG